ncbi:MAG: histone, partial [Halobacteriota archaeon]
MTRVELPFAPVDAVIRGSVGDLRVSADASEELASRIQSHGADVAARAAERARGRNRKTLRPRDFDFSVEVVPKDDLLLPVAPVDRIARLDVDDVRVSDEARRALTAYLEEWASNSAWAAGRLAKHAGRRTVLAEDFET